VSKKKQTHLLYINEEASVAETEHGLQRNIRVFTLTTEQSDTKVYVNERKTVIVKMKALVYDNNLYNQCAGLNL
jgi:hypothetical protein